MTDSRRRVLTELATRVLAVDRPHPVRVAIDGCSTAGKTTLADELAGVLREHTARQLVRVGIDAFPRPVELRTAYPQDSPDSYYLDSWDIAAVRDELLVPLGPGGCRRFAYRAPRPGEPDTPAAGAVGTAPRQVHPRRAALPA